MGTRRTQTGTSTLGTGTRNIRTGTADFGTGTARFRNQRFPIGSRLVPVYAPKGHISLHLAPSAVARNPSAEEVFEEALDEI